MERASGMGVSGGASTGTTFQMNSLNGSGLVIANYTTTGGPFTSTLSVGNNNGSGNFSGSIADGTNDHLSFIKAGSGTQTLSGINTFTGTTTVSLGTLNRRNETARPEDERP